MGLEYLSTYIHSLPSSGCWCETRFTLLFSIWQCQSCRFVCTSGAIKVQQAIAFFQKLENKKTHNPHTCGGGVVEVPFELETASRPSVLVSQLPKTFESECQFHSLPAFFWLLVRNKVHSSFLHLAMSIVSICLHIRCNKGTTGNCLLPEIGKQKDS